MKIMKNYFKAGFMGLVVSIIFSACSTDENLAKDEKQTQDSKSISKTASTNQSLLTVCDITGATVVTPGSAVVLPGSIVVYNYTNSTGTSGNIAWTVPTANPAGSIVISGTGSTVTVTFSSSFISGSISAYGTGGTANACQSTLNITKAVDPGANCCAPVMTMSYVCRGSSQTGNLGGFITIKSPLNCTVDWNNVLKIDMRIEGGPKFSGDSSLSGLKVGTLYPPFNFFSGNSIFEEFYYVGCLPRVTSKATIYYKNGCPPVSINAEAFSQ